MGDRYERLWRDYWRETHRPDSNGEYYFDRHDREERDEQDAKAKPPPLARKEP